MKKFLIIGNALTYLTNEIFPLVKEGKIWYGVSPRSMSFLIPDGSMKTVNAIWYTNLDHKKRHQKVTLSYSYDNNRSLYPEYDNCDGIDVIESKYIPYDYYGVMGVPTTFLSKLCPEQFEIVGIGVKHFPKTKTYDELFLLNENKKVGGSVSDQLFLDPSLFTNKTVIDKFKTNKRYYDKSNKEKLLIAPFTKLLIRRIDLDDKEFYGLDYKKD